MKPRQKKKALGPPGALDEPILIGVLRPDYEKAYAQAVAARLDELRQWHGISQRPNCWFELCLALAKELYPRAFSDKKVTAGKPQKWTMGSLMALAGEMRREMDGVASSQEKAAQCLAVRDLWKRFTASGMHKGVDREPWENLLYQYTRMPSRYRRVGTGTYLMHAHEGTLTEWEGLVRSFLERPA